MKQAYVTLLYNDFVAGTRALGRSLLDHESLGDMVVLVTPDVSSRTLMILEKDGWKIYPVSVTANPNQGFQSRLIYVYTKLTIFKMIEYDRIIFLDSDILILHNIDELFGCAPFCAVMRHGELLNSGVLVVHPNAELYSDMESKFGSLPSYTGGDQGFLNSFYSNFPDCPLFEPIDGVNVSNTSALCWRLPSRYNGDWPLLFVNGPVQVTQQQLGSIYNDWTLRKDVKVLHYTFGTAKPWNWWTYFFIPYVDRWVHTYAKLSSNGGLAPLFGFMQPFLRTIFWAILPLLVLWVGYKTYAHNSIARKTLLVAQTFFSKFVPACVLDRSSLFGNYISFLCGTSLLIGSVWVGMVVADSVAYPGQPVIAALIALTWCYILFTSSSLIILSAVQLSASNKLSNRDQPGKKGSLAENSSYSQEISLSPSIRNQQFTQSSVFQERIESSTISIVSLCRNTFGHFLAIFVQLLLLLCCGRLKGLDGLTITELIGTGIPIVLLLLVQCMWTFVSLPSQWAAYGAGRSRDSRRRV